MNGTFNSPWHTAARMLRAPNNDTAKLNRDLWNYLLNVQTLCEIDGGTLHSRQAVALAVTTWCLLNPGVSPLLK
jgi:hypothetical protein